MMKNFSVTGMSCSACSARVEKAVGAVDGVSTCSVSLLTNSMVVEGSADSAKIIKAVEEAGYSATEKGKEKQKEKSSPLEDKETPKLVRRLVWSLIFLLPLMYFSMGYTMWGFPLPEYFDKTPAAAALCQLLLTVAVMVVNQKFFVSGFKGLLHRAPNMDTLVALGCGASFGYSTYLLFTMLESHSHKALHGLYFESAAMILALITVGKMLEARSKGKTTNALKGLMDLSPKTARVERDGKEIQIPVEELSVGDMFILKAGDRVPVDGVIVSGSCTVDESALTGESVPVDKAEGERVSAATVNRFGYAVCRAQKVGEDTTLSQIIKMVSESAATKAPIAKVADKVSGIFVPVVMAISAVTLIVWLLLGESFGFAVIKAISVLVISCPCALGLATPVAIMVGSGKGAKGGILFKSAKALEETGRCNIILLDKTGTVTKGEPRVTDTLCAESFREEELLSYAYSLEAKSEHPLARAVVSYAREREIPLIENESFETLPGNGLSCIIDGESIQAGSYTYISKLVNIPASVENKVKALSEEGKTPLLFAKGESLLGVIAVSDTIKDDSKEAVAELCRMGLRVIMVTGDNERTGKAVAALAGIDEVIAGVLPDGKARVVNRLKEEGKVIMVGDGINDAPALTSANIGMAIGAGTDVAIDAADVVLMNSSLRDAAAAIKLSRKTLKNIYENLFWAFIYNVIGIPLAAGAFVAFGLQLSPMFGAAAMSLSSVCVVSNALRLNLFDIHAPQKRKNKTKKIKEKKQMEKNLKIEGMMCPHCEARVKKSLEALSEVSEALVSHETDSAKVILSAPIADEKLKKTVEDQGYTVLEIK